VGEGGAAPAVELKRHRVDVNDFLAVRVNMVKQGGAGPQNQCIFDSEIDGQMPKRNLEAGRAPYLIWAEGSAILGSSYAGVQTISVP